MVTFKLEISRVEQGLLMKILNSFLAELRRKRCSTKRETSDLHAEEMSVNNLLKKVSEAI